MPGFGDQSLARLETCCAELQLVAHEAIRFVDFSVLEGSRSDAVQARYFEEGKSRIDGVTRRSKHQVSAAQPLSLAFDLMPWPPVLHGVNVWHDRFRFTRFGGIVLGIARVHGITLRWGGDWDGDGSCRDQSFHDLPHFEVVGDITKRTIP